MGGGRGGTAIRWEGTSWSEVTPARFTGDLVAVGGTAPDDVWVVGDGGAVVRRGD